MSLSRRTGRPLRLLALLLSLAFPLASVEGALGAQHCPHHDSLHGEASQAHALHAGAHDAAPSARGAAHEHLAAEQAESDPHEGGGPCSCMGQCTTPAALQLAGAATLRARATAPTLRVLPTSARETARVLTGIYLIPYANAPPVLS